MSKQLKIGEIGQLLNRSASQLDRETLDKLQAARRTALQHQYTGQQSTVLAWLTEHGVIHHGATPYHRAYNFGVAVLLVAILFGGALYWQQTCNDHSDVDLAILTDDLPVEMYVD